MGRLTMTGRESCGGQPGYCRRCNQFMGSGPDACLGIIPGVSHACCGHGNTDHAYVVIGGNPDESWSEIESVTLQGALAIAFFALVEAGERHSPKVQVA